VRLKRYIYPASAGATYGLAHQQRWDGQGYSHYYALLENQVRTLSGGAADRWTLCWAANTKD